MVNFTCSHSKRWLPYSAGLYIFTLLSAFSCAASAQSNAPSPSFFPDGDVGSTAPLSRTNPPATILPPPTQPTATLPAKPLATPPSALPLPAPVANAPALSNALVDQESQNLHAAFQQEVSHTPPPPAELQALWISLARQQLESSQYRPGNSQVVVLVDRNPKVQRLSLVVINLNDQTWRIIGSTRVSTGKKGRKDYYITPVGVFTNTANRLGYRALGTKNEHGIMGNGTHGMRVWDFGWQQGTKGWLANHEQGPMRLEMHATDPYILEKKLGHTASAGCIRIPAPLNIFLDRHGLLDADYEQKSHTDKRFLALLRKDRTPSPLSGVAVIVIDTSNTVKTSPFTHTHHF